MFVVWTGVVLFFACRLFFLLSLSLSIRTCNVNCASPPNCSMRLSLHVYDLTQCDKNRQTWQMRQKSSNPLNLRHDSNWLMHIQPDLNFPKMSQRDNWFCGCIYHQLLSSYDDRLFTVKPCRDDTTHRTCPGTTTGLPRVPIAFLQHSRYE